MPLLSVIQATSVTIQVMWTITLDALPALAKPGDTVTFTGRVTADGAGKDNEDVRIWWDDPGFTFLSPAVKTGGGGYFSWPWTVPYRGKNYADVDVSFPCATHAFASFNVTAGTSAMRPLKIAYKTEIFKDVVGGAVGLQAPATAWKGVSFGIQGYLGKQVEVWDAPSGTYVVRWEAIPGKNVVIVYNGTAIGTVGTGADGRFSTGYTINTVGSYTVKATFGGEGLPAAAARAVTVAEWWQTAPVPQKAAVLLVAGLGVGAVLYYVARKR